MLAASVTSQDNHIHYDLIQHLLPIRGSSLSDREIRIYLEDVRRRFAPLLCAIQNPPVCSMAHQLQLSLADHTGIKTDSPICASSGPGSDSLPSLKSSSLDLAQNGIILSNNRHLH